MFLHALIRGFWLFQAALRSKEISIIFFFLSFSYELSISFLLSPRRRESSSHEYKLGSPVTEQAGDMDDRKGTGRNEEIYQ